MALRANGTSPQPREPAATDSPRTDLVSASRWGLLAVISVAQLMVVLDATIMNIAMPSAQRSLGFSNSDRQWIVTAYSLAFGSLLLLGGRLCDLIGRKTCLVAGLTGFAGASALGGAAHSFATLVEARVLQGCFAALLAPAALSLLTTTFRAGRGRARAFGVFGAVSGAGSAVGLLLGGVLTQDLSWRWTLYVNLILAALAIPAALALVSRQAPTRGARVDAPGAAMVLTGLFGVVLACANAVTLGWTSPVTWGLLLVGGALLGAFTFWEGRAEEPLLPLSLFADRDRAASFGCVVLSGAGMFAVFLFVTYYLQQLRGYSPLTNGLAFLPLIVVMMATAQLTTNILMSRLGARRIAPAGMALAATGMALLTRLGMHSSYAAHVLPSLLLVGLGMGLAVPMAMNLAVLGVEPSHAGAASAAVNTTQQIGGSLGTAVLNTLAASATAACLAGHQGRGGTANSPVQALAVLHGYVLAFWCAAGIFACGSLTAALAFRSRPRASGSRPE